MIEPGTIVITGASGGIGQALCTLLAARYPAARILATWRSSQPELVGDNIEWRQVDISCEDDIAALAMAAGKADWVINCVGLLHSGEHKPEKTIRRLAPEDFLLNLQVNCLPTLLLAKHFHPLLRQSQAGRFVAISARVGSIADNALGGWYSYRVSKAALNMALKNISIEWRRSLPRCSVAALHPGTVDTCLSEPFQSGLRSGQLLTPVQSADYLLGIITGLTPDNSGQFWAWDGEILPW